MPTLIEELARGLRAYSNLAVQVQATDLLVTLPVGGGRRQTVKVFARRLPGTAAGHVVRLQSRAGVVRDAALVSRALRQNGDATLPGFALDASAEVPALDVVCGLVAETMTMAELVDALRRVAVAADAVEATLAGGADRF